MTSNQTRGDAARLWHNEVSHLVQAHGADSDRLLALGLNLGKTQWVHFDTHAALDIAQVRPPDGHAHPVLRDPEDSAPLRTWDPKTETWHPVIPNPEDPSEPLVYYRPFRGSGYAHGRTAAYCGPKYMVPGEHTSLPQTEMTAPHDADVTGRWADLAIDMMRRHLQGIASEGSAWTDPSHSSSLPWRLLGRREEVAGMDPEQVIAEFRGEVRDLAAACAARWQARTSSTAGSLGFPGKARPGIQGSTVDFPLEVMPGSPASSVPAPSAPIRLGPRATTPRGRRTP